MKKSFRLLAFLAALAVMGLLLMPGISSAQNIDNPGNHYGNGNNPNGNQGNHYGNQGNNDPVAVPEPRFLLLVGSGLLGLVAFKRKFKK